MCRQMTDLARSFGAVGVNLDRAEQSRAASWRMGCARWVQFGLLPVQLVCQARPCLGCLGWSSSGISGWPVGEAGKAAGADQAEGSWCLLAELRQQLQGSMAGLAVRSHRAAGLLLVRAALSRSQGQPAEAAWCLRGCCSPGCAARGSGISEALPQLLGACRARLEDSISVRTVAAGPRSLGQGCQLPRAVLAKLGQ